MKTQIKREGNTIIVSMDGRLDFAAQAPLREDLAKLAKQTHADSIPKHIIFNMEKLEFVGSSGISSFIQTLKEFNNSTATKPKYCHFKSEFRKIIQAFEDDQLFEFYEDEDSALESTSH
jgi:anti-anti-sigma factor